MKPIRRNTLKAFRFEPESRGNPSDSGFRRDALGEGTRIGANCSSWAGNGTVRIVLGRYFFLGPNVMITAANYRFNDGAPLTDQAMKEVDAIIGDDVWIGYGAVISPGSEIGDRAIIRVGARLKGDVPQGASIADLPSPK